MIRFLHKLSAIFSLFLLCLFFLWAAAALYFDASTWLSIFLALVCIIAGIYFRSIRPTSLFVLLSCVVVLAWWLTLSPDNHRDWRPEVARLPGASIDGARVSITNVRNFNYRTENSFTENWETRSFNLDELVGADLFLNFWGPEHIAHTIVSWRFANGTHIAVSIETRKESLEEYSAIKGFFRQFEVYYVVADERDLIKLRTDHRGEQVYLYKLGFPLAEARAMLLDYLGEINRLKEKPRWYNALTHNCTTAIRYHSKHIGAAGSLDWRLFLNGHLAELGYERGVLDQSLPLNELRQASYISEKARIVPADANFSISIRQGLPGFTQ
jgi:hypothetical protein